MPDITEIDPNFKTSVIPYDNTVWYDAMDERFSLHGLYDPRGTGRYMRLPLAFSAEPLVNDGVKTLMFHTAGGRIRFATDSPYVAVAMELPGVGHMAHMPLTGSSGADIYFAPEGSADMVCRKTIFPAIENGVPQTAFSGCGDNPVSGCAEVTIHLPLYNAVTRVYIGLAQGACIKPPRAFSVEKPVLFYGSSITQGGCASRPGNNYMNHVCRWLDADFINLGFSGSAKGELCVADYIASLDLSAFVMDYDHNAPDPEHLARTHYPFYRRVREAHPELPIVFISAPFPFPASYIDHPYRFAERHDIILRSYLRGVDEGDKRLFFLDGMTLYADRDQDACTVDGCHPNDLGFYRFAQAVYPVLRKALEV